MKIRNNKDLEEYKKSRELESLDFSEWEERFIHLSSIKAIKVTIKNIDLTNLTILNSHFSGEVVIRDSRINSIGIDLCTYHKGFVQSDSVSKSITIKNSRFEGEGTVFNQVKVRSTKCNISGCDFRGQVHIGISAVTTCYWRNVFRGDVIHKIIHNTHFYLTEISNNTFEGSLDQSKSDFKGGLILRDEIDFTKYKGRPLSIDDIRILRLIDLSRLQMRVWHSDDEWKLAESEEEAHKCGTTHCIRGYAELRYLLDNGHTVSTVEDLGMGLKHLFYLPDEDAKKEIIRLLEKFKDIVLW